MDKYIDYKGKRLLILGGAAQCCKVVEAAKEMGIYTIVTDINANGGASLMADEALPYSVMDTENIINWCRNNPVDGVLNFCIDFAQNAHQKICAEFGFPCYGTAEQYRILTDKQEFKKLCTENGVDVIPEYSADNPDEIEYPVIVKPAESSGSRGTTVCRDETMLIEAIKTAEKESKNGEVLIEKYLYGRPDFSMSYIIIDGEPHLTRTLDRFVGRPEDNLQRQCICARSPSIYTDLYLKNAHEKVVEMLESFGLKNATVFMQGFIDGDKFRFYDPGIRFSGSEYERMLKGATGIDPVKAFISYSLGGSLTEFGKELDKAYLLNGLCGLQLFIDAYPGEIAFIDGVEDVDNLPQVVKIIQKHDVGYVVPASGDVKQRIFEIVVLVENKKEKVEEAIAEIDKRLIVHNTQGGNMLTPIIEIGRMFET